MDPESAVSEMEHGNDVDLHELIRHSAILLELVVIYNIN